MFPPGNDGSKKGAGIVREDGSTNDSGDYVFQTPQDLSDVPLELNSKITFEGKNKEAKLVKKDTVRKPVR
jgi:hypothetical protein